MATSMPPPPSYNYLRTPRTHVHHFVAARPMHARGFRSLVNTPHTPLLHVATAAASSGPSNSPSNHWYQEDGSSSEDLLQLFHDRVEVPPQGPGAVYLVGTGPGDPGLLTLKAVRLMQTAHVVLYDRLVSEDILRLVNPSALMVYVGKQRSYHTRTQDEIHNLLRTFAADAGATVVRLKGGDPYVFGRGGEEVQYLEERGVKVYAVPGITAAAGISAELGIPLTHRGLATSVRFLTGHAREGGQPDLDAAVATAVDPFTTLVVYMGLATLRTLSGELTNGGLPADTPAVAVERGTTPEQRAVWATLGELADQVDSAELKSPTLIVIGKVVALAQGWKQAEREGTSLQSPGAHQLPLPVLPGLVATTVEDQEESTAGWRML